MTEKHLVLSNQNYNAHYVKSVNTPEHDYFSMHIHDLFEVYYFIQGDVTYQIEGNNYKLESGDLLLINNKEVHKPISNSNKIYERIAIHFAPWYFSRYNDINFNILECFENRKPGQYNLISAERIEDNNLDYYLKQINKYLSSEEDGKNIMFETLFVQLLFQLNKIFSQDEKILIDSIEYNEIVTKIIKYINNNLEKKFSLDEIAQELYLDKYYIAHLFKENTGFSILQYINYKKIMKAKELLSTDYNCSQVASKLNFSNYSNFYKTFKKETGISPSQYQNKNLF